MVGLCGVQDLPVILVFLLYEFNNLWIFKGGSRHPHYQSLDLCMNFLSYDIPLLSYNNQGLSLFLLF